MVTWIPGTAALSGAQPPCLPAGSVPEGSLSSLIAHPDAGDRGGIFHHCSKQALFMASCSLPEAEAGSDLDGVTASSEHTGEEPAAGATALASSTTVHD